MTEIDELMEEGAAEVRSTLLELGYADDTPLTPQIIRELFKRRFPKVDFGTN